MSGEIVKIENLKFSWPDQNKPLIHIKSLTLNSGEKFFLRGPSGSGKSTLLNILSGIIKPHSGTIEILNQNINKLSPTQMDQFRVDHLGYIFQTFNLIPYLSVLENVLLPCRFSKKRANRVELERDSLNQESLRLLNRLDLKGEEILNKKAHALSVGQQQRVAAARALMGFPSIIIADEPTSALDEDHKNAFIKLLVSECEAHKITLFFVSHDKTLTSYFDRVVDLDTLNQGIV